MISQLGRSHLALRRRDLGWWVLAVGAAALVRSKEVAAEGVFSWLDQEVSGDVNDVPEEVREEAAWPKDAALDDSYVNPPIKRLG
jgi:hypothetical protein